MPAFWRVVKRQGRQQGSELHRAKVVEVHSTTKLSTLVERFHVGIYFILSCILNRVGVLSHIVTLPSRGSAVVVGVVISGDSALAFLADVQRIIRGFGRAQYQPYSFQRPYL